MAKNAQTAGVGGTWLWRGLKAAAIDYLTVAGRHGLQALRRVRHAVVDDDERLVVSLSLSCPIALPALVGPTVRLLAAAPGPPPAPHSLLGIPATSTNLTTHLLHQAVLKHESSIHNSIPHHKLRLGFMLSGCFLDLVFVCRSKNHGRAPAQPYTLSHAMSLPDPEIRSSLPTPKVAFR